MELIYEGYIVERDYGEQSAALFLLPNTDDIEVYKDGDEPLARELEESIYGKMVSVKYYITDKKCNLEELKERHIAELCGIADAQYTAIYSEITGYLWTEENVEIGGHDLLDELISNVGKYVILIIDVNETQKSIKD